MCEARAKVRQEGKGPPGIKGARCQEQGRPPRSRRRQDRFTGKGERKRGPWEWRNRTREEQGGARERHDKRILRVSEAEDGERAMDYWQNKLRGNRPGTLAEK